METCHDIFCYARKAYCPFLHTINNAKSSSWRVDKSKFLFSFDVTTEKNSGGTDKRLGAEEAAC